MQTFLRSQPRIESFLNKDVSLSIVLRSTQLNSVIIEYYDIELPVGLIKIIIEYENTHHVIHHQYQQYVAPKLLLDHYPRNLLKIYKILHYTSSIIAIFASFYHLQRWLNQAASTNSDALPSTATITSINNHQQSIASNSISVLPHNDKLPTFLTLFPIPGSLTIFNNISPNLFSSQYSSLYPSIYITIPIFAIWTGLEFIKNVLFFNTNRNIQKLSYFMPVDSTTKSITNSLFNEWNEFFYTDNYGLSPKRFILSYTNEMQSILDTYDEHDRFIHVDENDDDGSHINFNDEYETEYTVHDQYNGIDGRDRNISHRNSIIVPNPKYANRNSKLPLPSYKHFLLQNNTLFAIIMLHSTLLPISRTLLKYNHLFLPNTAIKTNPNINGKKFASLQSITSHKNNILSNTATKFMKLSNIMLSHTYCLLHVVSTSIIPVIGLRSVIFGNMSNQLQDVLNPMHLNHNANAANAALAHYNDDIDGNDNDDDDDDGNDNDDDDEDDDDDDDNDDDNDNDDDIEDGINNNHRNAFEEYIDKWSISNHLTSISLMLSMVPYVNNFYAMMSVFSFGMTLGEGEDIMRWSAYRLLQNNLGNYPKTNKINNVWYTYYIPWIAGVIGITCSFTIEVWASSNNIKMANRFKKISLISLLLSISLSFGNRSYLETGFYLKYKNGRNIFEKMTEYAVEIELGMKTFIKNLQERNGGRQRVQIAA